MGGYHPPPGTSTISGVTFLWRGIPAQLLPQNVCRRISYSYLKSQNYILYESIGWCRKTKGVGGNHPPLGSPRVNSRLFGIFFCAIWFPTFALASRFIRNDMYISSTNPHCNCLLFCRAFNNCSANLRRTGCTFRDLFIQVLQKTRWTSFNTYDLTQQRYKEVINSLHHLCSNIEPGNTLALQ